MDYLELAMEYADKLGADYADMRIQRTHTESIYLRKLSLKDTSEDVIYGYGIRVLKNGAWGFAHCSIFDQESVISTVKKAFEIAAQSARLRNGDGIKLAHERSYIDTFKTPVIVDPFSVPLKEKVDFLMEINKTMLNYNGIRLATAYIETRRDEKLFASTTGTRLDLSTTLVYPSFTATAVNDNDSQSRSFNNGAKAAGWEYVEGMNLLNKAHQIAEEAIMKVNAESLDTTPARRDLIIDPMNLSLTMHESVGHPTELDRVLGWEADYAGISFATPEKLKNYRYGSSIVNFVGDNTLSYGLATAGYDDDGVPGQKWYIIKDGILNEYGSTRETIPFIGGQSSRGCSRATYYSDFPINRIPNLYLEPGKNTLSPEDLIADTEDGVYIEGQGSFSIDQHRVNFQFGGDLFYEIKNGKKTRMLKKILYISNNPEFWNSCDAICDSRYFKTFGVTNCGKGQPPQSARMTHGASMARFKQIRVGGSK